MKNFIKILILPIAIITMMIGFAPKVFAQPAPLSVQFVPDPLFVKPNFLPLDETSGTVTVTNNSGATQTIATEAINVLDNDNFGSLLRLKIVENSISLYDDSLADFFSTAGEFSLGIISAGQTRIFTYTISFIDSSDNSYQGKTLGFDVCVGFQGGQTHCGDTVIGDDEDPDDGDGDGDGGGGGGTIIHGSGSGSSTPLIIFNENASNISANGFIPESGQATITWDTNKLATSQVVYGPISSPPSPYTFPYTLALIPPNYGYPYYTTEDSTKVINHSMFLTGLNPGQTYKFRVISRASPATVSPEFQFTVPLPTNELVLGASTGNDETAGSVLGEATAPEETSNLNNVLAATIASGWGGILSICTLIALLILLVIYLIWRIWLRKKYEKALVREEEIKNRFYIFFGSLSLLAILILLALNEYCPLPILLIAFIISACLYAYRKFRIK